MSIGEKLYPDYSDDELLKVMDDHGPGRSLIYEAAKRIRAKNAQFAILRVRYDAVMRALVVTGDMQEEDKQKIDEQDDLLIAAHNTKLELEAAEAHIERLKSEFDAALEAERGAVRADADGLAYALRETSEDYHQSLDHPSDFDDCDLKGCREDRKRLADYYALRAAQPKPLCSLCKVALVIKYLECPSCARSFTPEEWKEMQNEADRQYDEAEAEADSL